MCFLKQKTQHLKTFFPSSPHLLFTPVIASSPHVFTSFSSALWWHHWLTHSDTYTVLLKLPSRAFGWGLVFVVDRIAVINVPSPDPSCSLHPRPSLRQFSWANPIICFGLRCPCLCAHVYYNECLGDSNDVWERLGVCSGCLIIS